MVTKIISGVQTGADQGGLWAAYECGISTGGYAPRNFLTEDGPNPDRLKFYNLVDSGLGYVGRTRLNAGAADVTLWFGKGDTPGYKATLREVKQAGKIFVNATNLSVNEIAQIMQSHNIVNIAGNRESKLHGIFKTVGDTVKLALLLIKEGKVNVQSKLI
jgi:hypothetical protein